MNANPEPTASDSQQAPVSWRGGARTDLVNATYPFATLTATGAYLELSVASMHYRFSCEQVAAIEVVRAVPLIGSGVRIHHRIPGYPQLIVFWSWGNPRKVAEKLREFGFGNDASPYPSTFFPESIIGIIILAVVFAIGIVSLSSCLGWFH